MTKEQIYRLMSDAAKVTTFLEDDKIFYMASRTPDGSDEMIEMEKFYISTEFMNNIIKQVAKECISICEDMDGVDNFEQMMNPRTSRYECVAEIKEHFGIE